MKIKGYLNLTNNPSLEPYLDGGNFNELKQIYIKILDKECIEKIYKQMLRFPDRALPIYKSLEGGILIKLCTKKLSKYMNQTMLKTPRKDWIDKEYTVKFNIVPYSFLSSSEKQVEGINFILDNLILENI
jgi:hypothetical protein